MVEQYIFFCFLFLIVYKMTRNVSITCPIFSPWKNTLGTLKCSPPAIQWRPVVNKHVTLVLQENRDNMWDGGAHALLAFDVGGTVVCLVHKIARWQYAFPNQSSFFPFCTRLSVRSLEYWITPLKTVAVILMGNQWASKDKRTWHGCCPPPCKTTTGE